MNKQIQKLAAAHLLHERWSRYGESTEEDYFEFDPEELDAFVKAVVEECRTVLLDLYHKTPIELCGPLLTADKRLLEHFYSNHETKITNR